MPEEILSYRRALGYSDKYGNEQIICKENVLLNDNIFGMWAYAALSYSMISKDAYLRLKVNNIWQR